MDIPVQKTLDLPRLEKHLKARRQGVSIGTYDWEIALIYTWIQGELITKHPHQPRKKNLYLLLRKEDGKRK